MEDDDDIQSLLKHILKRDGYDVTCADSGMTALGAMAQSIPDLILLDMAMPDMDGLSFLKRRAQFPEFRVIPVICVTARDRNTDVMAAIEMGADHYVTKPFDNAKLLASIARLMPKTSSLSAEVRAVVWK
ncbi:response regulator [Asticcacaulis biprosthecium C19]|uniref:Response regulator n=1 Tax=Asticcacaulis biprosthecium C19 TaxID=715226 RepID=F4QSE9_9CAUL|nr:response regulator [Asticcacaulis biprosthecium C19]